MSQCAHAKITRYHNWARPFDRCRMCGMRRYHVYSPPSPFRKYLPTLMDLGGRVQFVDVTTMSGEWKSGQWQAPDTRVEGQKRLRKIEYNDWD